MPEADFRVASLDIRKLRDYCLNIESPRVSHKARVFRSALDITADDAEWLRSEILRLLPAAEPVAGPVDRHGARFRVDLRISRHGRQTVCKNGVDRGSEFTRASFSKLLGTLMLQKRTRANDQLKLFDVVELLSDASDPAVGPWGGAVSAGALGTIVEELSDDFYLVEFDGDGRAEPVILTLPGSSLALARP